MRRPPKHAAPAGQRRARAESWPEPGPGPAQSGGLLAAAGPEPHRWPGTAAGPVRNGYPAGRRSAAQPAREEADAAAWQPRKAAHEAVADPADLAAADGVPPWELRNGGAPSRPETPDQPAAQPSPDQLAAGQPAAGQPAAGQPAAGQPAAGQPAATQLSGGYQSWSAWPSWHVWRLSRPFWGAAVAIAGSAELALTGGIVGWLGSGGHATPVLLLAAGLVLCALLLCFHPVWRSAYSTAAVLLAVIALITDHVGGYLAGSLIAAVGGAIAFAWVPARGPMATRPDGPRSAGDEPPAAAGTRPDMPGQVPELTLIRGEAISLPGLPPLN